MVSLELRQAWAEVAYREYKSKVGKDFCPSERVFKNYLEGFFGRDRFKEAAENNLGVYYNSMCDALELDFPNKDVARPLYDTLQRHFWGEIKIPHMKLQICDGAAP